MIAPGGSGAIFFDTYAPFIQQWPIGVLPSISSTRIRH